MVFLQSQPHLALQKYIGQYLYFSFNTSSLPCLNQVLLPYDIPAISFFIGPVFFDTNENVNCIKSSPFPTYASYFAGLRTSPSVLRFDENKDIKVFAIALMPSGFSALFSRNMADLTNEVPNFSSLAGASDTSAFFDQLSEAKDFATQSVITDNFFLKRIPDNSVDTRRTMEACRLLMLSKGKLNMKELAYHTNMSLRNLERQFTEKVGVPPKMFARFKRFHHALSLMNHQKPASWSSIAYQCGYYDQAHFIKEFKAFSNHSPSSYSPSEYLLYNQIILFRNFSSF